ncbi:hypothetical protein [Aquimarina algiphila]|uniref:hypothetical protein n=1 Tax=Aquimarina algiphila TaxID=2047982 RepID=UPI00232D8472|nr:hypothetical protein [Aquimarina algiphila]
MNLGFKESIDIDVLKRILDIKLNHPKMLVTISVELPMNDNLKSNFQNNGIRVIENKLDLFSSRLIQYKFEWK